MYQDIKGQNNSYLRQNIKFIRRNRTVFKMEKEPQNETHRTKLRLNSYSIISQWRHIVVLVVSFFGLGYTYGMSQTFGIVYLEFQQSFSVSKTVLAWTGALNGLMLFLPGSFASWLVKRIGPRWVIIIGTLCMCFGTVLAAIAPTFWVVALGYGAMVGTGGCFMTTGSYLVLPRFFDKRLTAATAFATIGTAVVTVALPFVMRPLIAAYGWRLAVSWYACLMMQLCLLAMFIGDGDVRNEPEAKQEKMEPSTKDNTRNVTANTDFSTDKAEAIEVNSSVCKSAAELRSTQSNHGSGTLLKVGDEETFNSVTHLYLPEATGDLNSASSQVSVQYLTLGGSFVALHHSEETTHASQRHFGKLAGSGHSLMMRGRKRDGEEPPLLATVELETSSGNYCCDVLKSCDLHLFLTVSFFWAASTTVFFQYMAEYTDRIYLETSYDATSFLYVALSVGIIGMSLSMVVWADKTGEYQLAVFGVGNVILGGFGLLFGFIQGFAYHIVIIFIIGIGTAMVRGFLTKACVQVLSADALEFVFGLVYVVSSMAGFVGPLIAGAILDAIGNNFGVINSIMSSCEIISGTLLTIRGIVLGYRRTRKVRSNRAYNKT